MIHLDVFYMLLFENLQYYHVGKHHSLLIISPQYCHSLNTGTSIFFFFFLFIIY